MKYLLFLAALFSGSSLAAQDNFHVPFIGITSGMINYEGDLKPNSFTFQNSNFHFSAYVRLPLTNKISWRTGIGFGKIEASDKDNREYLQIRNLNFSSAIQELYTGIQFEALDLTKNRFTPYLFAGAAVYHFAPYTFDESNQKIFLQPLSTEGQGLAEYPDRKPYQLTQIAFAWNGGVKYRIGDGLNLGVEFSQRKTFTDYLDDVSSSYVDYNKLLQAKGQKAVDLAFRGDELPNGGPYPHEGEQRGTPGEKDWYYMLDVSVEVNFDAIKSGLNGMLKSGPSNQKCPTRF